MEIYFLGFPYRLALFKCFQCNCYIIHWLTKIAHFLLSMKIIFHFVSQIWKQKLKQASPVNTLLAIIQKWQLNRGFINYQQDDWANTCHHNNSLHSLQIIEYIFYQIYFVLCKYISSPSLDNAWAFQNLYKSSSTSRDSGKAFIELTWCVRLTQASANPHCQESSLQKFVCQIGDHVYILQCNVRTQVSLLISLSILELDVDSIFIPNHVVHNKWYYLIDWLSYNV